MFKKLKLRFREAIIRGRRLFEGHHLNKDIWYLCFIRSCSYFVIWSTLDVHHRAARSQKQLLSDVLGLAFKKI